MWGPLQHGSNRWAKLWARAVPPYSFGGPGLAARALVVWLFVNGDPYGKYNDTLQSSRSPTGPWLNIPGPYTVISNFYQVPVTNQGMQFFRVCRIYGTNNIK